MTIITIAEMEREEVNKDKAIQLLERLQDPEPYEPMLTKDAYDAIQMAIDALSADGDTISRKAAIERATKEHDFFRGAVTVSDKARRDELLNVMCWLGELQPVQPEPKRGKWIKISPSNIYECSECGKHVMTNDICAYDFCHVCGADMRGVAE